MGGDVPSYGIGLSGAYGRVATKVGSCNRYPRTGQPLARNPGKEQRDADEVATGQSARLLAQTIEPFKTPPLHPRHRARNIAGKEVEQSSDADPDNTTRRGEMLLDEEFLLRIAHRHEQDIGLGAANVLDNLGELAGIEMAVMATDNRVLRA